MPTLKGLEWTFDTVASTYEKLRPGYIDELYREIFGYVFNDNNSHVVEIGSGGGQATAPLLETGCRLIAVEYGEMFSQLLKDKFKKTRNFRLLQENLKIQSLKKIFLIWCFLC